MKTYINLSPIRKAVFSFALLLTIWLCVTVAETVAQTPNSTTADVGFQFSSSTGLGYIGNSYGGTTRMLLKASPRFAIEPRLDILSAKKYVGNGHGYVGKLDVHGFILDGVSVIGGIAYRRQVTREFTSSEFNPSLGAAYWRKGYRFQAQYEFPAHVGVHKTRAVVLSGEGIHNFTSFYVAVRPEVQIVRFEQIGLGKLTGYRGGFSISIGKRLSD